MLRPSELPPAESLDAPCYIDFVQVTCKAVVLAAALVVYACVASVAAAASTRSAGDFPRHADGVDAADGLGIEQSTGTPADGALAENAAPLLPADASRAAPAMRTLLRPRIVFGSASARGPPASA